MYMTQKKQIGHREECDEMTEESGRLWSDIATWFWRIVRRQDSWLSKSAVQRWLCQSSDVDGLHSQSAQAVADQFFDALDSWRENRSVNGSRPPYKRKNYNKVIFKSSAITLRDGMLYLSRGRGHDPIAVEWEHAKPKRIELRYNKNIGEHELCCQYEVEPVDRTTGNKIASIDLGEIHLATVYDGEKTILFNGKELRSKRRYQNKIKAELDSKIDRKERGSNRWWKLVNSKNKQLADIRNQIRDLCHKMSRKLVEVLLERGVSTLVVGDVREIRQDLDYGSKANQKMHQWAHGTFRRMIKYKAELAGMDVELIDEAYTSRTCPDCGVVKDHSPNSRNFVCQECGFRYHRDGVGSMNIRQKYLGGDPSSSGDGVPLRGVRFDTNMRCRSSSQRKTSLEAVA